MLRQWKTGTVCLRSSLLGGLLLLLLLLLGITFILLWSSFNRSFFLLLLLLLFLLDSNKEANNLLGLDHVVLIDLKLIEDVINLRLGHLVIDLATLVIGHESLEDELIGVVAVSGHLLLEHVDHAHDVAGSSDLSHQLIELTLRHEDTNVVKSSTEIIFVQGTVLVDVHQLEAVLVHLDLLLREASFILSLAHDEMRVLFCIQQTSNSPC